MRDRKSRARRQNQSNFRSATCPTAIVGYLPHGRNLVRRAALVRAGQHSDCHPSWCFVVRGAIGCFSPCVKGLGVALGVHLPCCRWPTRASVSPAAVPLPLRVVCLRAPRWSASFETRLLREPRAQAASGERLAAFCCGDQMRRALSSALCAKRDANRCISLCIADTGFVFGCSRAPRRLLEGRPSPEASSNASSVRSSAEPCPATRTTPTETACSPRPTSSR
jgi:hypothetical protein